MGKRKRAQTNPRDRDKDRISELPSHIRQYILSFLPTQDALRSSVLSTTWRYDWLRLPCLDFGKAFFQQHWKHSDLKKRMDDNFAKTEKFLAFLNEALIRPRHTIQKLQLYLPAWNELDSNIASCINGLTVYDLHLDITRTCLNTCRLPESILSSVSITKLSLFGLNLTSTPADVIQLPSLRDLSLSKVVTDPRMVENLIADCPALENLCFSDCEGFSFLKVVGLPELRELMVELNSGLERVEIDAPSLYSLHHEPHPATRGTELVFLSPSCRSLTRLVLNYGGAAHVWVIREQLLNLKKLICTTDVLQHIIPWVTSLETMHVHVGEDWEQVDITSCQNLADLTLVCYVGDDWLNRHLRLLPHLRVLYLLCCDTPTHLNISSINLEYLTIEYCPNLEHVEIDCANLSNFRYCTDSRLAFLSSSTALTPYCVSVEFDCGFGKESLSYLQLIGMFKKLRHSKDLSLCTGATKNVIIPGELRQSNNSPYCQFENIKLQLRKPLTVEDAMSCIDSFLWLCPKLKTIRIMQCEIDILLKLEYKVPMELGSKGCGCYETLPITCWRHSLKGFEIIKHCGIEDDGSLRKFFKSTIIATRTDNRIKKDQRN